MRRRAGFVAGVPAIALVAFAVVTPFVGLLVEALRAGDLFDVWSRPGVGSTIWFSLWMGVVSTVVTLALGLPAAWITARRDFGGRSMARTILGVPFVLPTVVVGAAFLAIAPHGRGTVAIVAAHAFFNISVVMRTTAPVLSSFDDDLLHAARTLGARPIRLFREVVWPLMGSATTAAAGLVFVLSATSYGIVRILGDATRSTIDVEIYRRAITYGDTSGAAVLALVQAIVMSVVIVWTGSRRNPTLIEMTVARRARAARFQLIVIWTLAVAFVAPLTALVVRSFRGAGHWTTAGWRAILGIGQSTLGDVGLGGAVINSVKFAVLATVIAVPIGVAICRWRRRSRLMSIVTSAPVAVSAVMVGLGILVTYDQGPFDFRAAWWLIPVVHASVALPYVVRAVRPLVHSIPIGLNEAAATLGASPWRVWWRVELPLLKPAVATAAATSLAISLGEFGATSLLTRHNSRTLPLMVESLLGRSGGIGITAGSAAATLLLVTTAALILILDRGVRV